MKKLIAILCCLLSSHAFGQQYDITSVPNPKELDASTYVSNPDGIISEQTVAKLNTLLDGLEQETSSEVAVVVLGSIGNEGIEDFGTRLFKHWGIGKKKHANGLLILFVLDQRKVRFEVGYGLEGIMPDAICKRIQQQEMVPYFKDGEYNDGILAGVERAASVIRKEPFDYEEDVDVLALLGNIGSIVFKIVVAFIIIILIIVSFFNRGSGGSSSSASRGSFGGGYSGGSHSGGSFGGGRSGGGGATSGW